MTFTVGFEREATSEIDIAARVRGRARRRARHQVVITAEQFAAAIPEVVWYLDDPVADPALVPLYFVAREARKHVKVVLSGEGADELFGGYTIYREPLSLAGLERLPPGWAGRWAALSNRLPDGLRGKDLLRRGSIPLEERYYGNARIFSGAELAGLLRGHDADESHVHGHPGPLPPDPRRRLRRRDGHAVRGPVHLAAGRHPGQGGQDDDGQLAGAARAVPGRRGVRPGRARIPLEQRVPRGSDATKYALRRAMEQIVPPAILHRRKLGFPVPTPEFLAGPLHDWAHQIIADSQTDEWLNRAAVAELLSSLRTAETPSKRVARASCGRCWSSWCGTGSSWRSGSGGRARDGVPRPAVTCPGLGRPGARRGPAPPWGNRASSSCGQIRRTSPRRHRSCRRWGCRS